jgi:hypothetical protein
MKVSAAWDVCCSSVSHAVNAISMGEGVADADAEALPAPSRLLLAAWPFPQAVNESSSNITGTASALSRSVVAGLAGDAALRPRSWMVFIHAPLV